MGRKERGKKKEGVGEGKKRGSGGEPVVSAKRNIDSVAADKAPHSKTKIYCRTLTFTHEANEENSEKPLTLEEKSRHRLIFHNNNWTKINKSSVKKATYLATKINSRARCYIFAENLRSCPSRTNILRAKNISCKHESAKTNRNRNRLH